MEPDPSRKLSRRESLALITGATVALAGCSGGGDGDGDGDGGGAEPTDTPTPTETPTSTPTDTATPTPTATATEVAADTTVVVGPGGSLSFDPEQVGVSVGDTVAFEFDSSGHNVSAVPDHHSEIEIPDGAEPFASYSGDDKYATVPAGTVYTNTFETAGKFTYVCVPHVGGGMIGSITVR